MEKVKIYRNVVRLKDLDLFYLDTRTAGPAILCLHGRWGRAEVWSDFMLHYGNRFRIIAPDQRGHGLSGKPEAEYTVEEMAGDVIELLDHLEIGSAILVGHSMGGAIVGYLAAKYLSYVKAAAILDKSAAGPAITDKVPVPERTMLKDPYTGEWPLPFSTLDDAMDFIRRTSHSELEYQYFMKSLVETVEGYKMMFNSEAMALNTANYIGWYDLLPEIHCPVLLVRSKSHEAVPDEDYVKMQSLLKNCTAREMSNPDHNVFLSNKEEFYGYFDGFLKEVR